MKWFYNLKRSYRILIVCATLIPMCILGATIGENTYNATPVQSFLSFVFVSAFFFFLVFAIVARSKEKAVSKEAIEKAAKIEEQERQAEIEKRRVEREQERMRKLSSLHFPKKPTFTARLVRNSKEEMQDSIACCSVGDECSIECDYDSGLYLVSCGGDIGFLPEKYDSYFEGMEVDDDFIKIIISDIDEGVEKSSVYVDVYCGYFDSDSPSEQINISFPVRTKARGVTFEGRQEHLKNSVVGDALSITHTPSPEYPDTISITNVRTGENLGNVSADIACLLVSDYGEGCSFVGAITDITGVGKANLGCNFTIDGVS